MLLDAVQDLLAKADMSLSAEAEELMRENLRLKEDLERLRGERGAYADEVEALETEVRHAREAFTCPITLRVMEDPVLLKADGMSYEKAAITEWLRSHGRSPLNRAPAGVADLVPNRALRTAIENLK